MANKTRPQQMLFRVSDIEAEIINNNIQKSGKNKQEYLLTSAIECKILNTDGIKELMPELKRIGNNLNQIAKELNGRGYYNYNLITDNQKELSEIWQLLRQYLQNVE